MEMCDLFTFSTPIALSRDFGKFGMTYCRPWTVHCDFHDEYCHAAGIVNCIGCFPVFGTVATPKVLELDA